MTKKPRKWPTIQKLLIFLIHDKKVQSVGLTPTPPCFAIGLSLEACYGPECLTIKGVHLWSIIYFQDMCLFAHYLWTAPLSVALSLYFLWQKLGVVCLAGLTYLLIIVPFNSIFIGKKMRQYQVIYLVSAGVTAKMYIKMILPRYFLAYENRSQTIPGYVLAYENSQTPGMTWLRCSYINILPV